MEIVEKRGERCEEVRVWRARWEVIEKKKKEIKILGNDVVLVGSKVAGPRPRLFYSIGQGGLKCYSTTIKQDWEMI